MELDTYGLPLNLITDICGIHPNTARRWKRLRRIPAPYAALVSLKTTGDLGPFLSGWAGWALKPEGLWTPEGRLTTQGEIRALPYIREQLRELQREATRPHQGELF